MYALLMFTWTALTTFIAHLKNFFFIHYLYRYQQFQQEWPIYWVTGNYSFTFCCQNETSYSNFLAIRSIQLHLLYIPIAWDSILANRLYRLQTNREVIDNSTFAVSRVIPRQMSRFSEIPTHFVLGSCSNVFSVLTNYPHEQIQNLSILLQIVLQLKLFSWHMVGSIFEQNSRTV